MDKQYQDINNLADEILGVFYIVIPIFIFGSATLIFKDELLNHLMSFNTYIISSSF